jgi:hypothetical protein
VHEATGSRGVQLGDTVDTSGCYQVDFTDPMRAEEDAISTVRSTWSEGSGGINIYRNIDRTGVRRWRDVDRPKR